MRIAPLTVLIALLAALPLPSQAEGIAVPVQGIVSEAFDKTARVAGSRIVGVEFAPRAEQSFDPNSVNLLDATLGATLCIRAISRDGLYWMRTPYVPKGSAPFHLQPFSHQPERLKKYNTDAIAIYAFEVTPTGGEDACLAAKDNALTIVPAWVGNDRSDQLRIKLNSGNRKVTGSISGQGRIALNCAPPASNERIAYDRVCAATLDDAALQTLGEAPHNLKLEFSDGLSKTQLEAKIWLGKQ